MTDDDVSLYENKLNLKLRFIVKQGWQYPLVVNLRNKNFIMNLEYLKLHSFPQFWKDRKTNRRTDKKLVCYKKISLPNII